MLVTHIVHMAGVVLNRDRSLVGVHLVVCHSVHPVHFIGRLVSKKWSVTVAGVAHGAHAVRWLVEVVGTVEGTG